MDDVSSAMGISKKTLYGFVENKSDLVKKCMKAFAETEKIALKKIAQENNNAIDELFAIVKHIRNLLKNFHPSIHYDLQKYYPEGWQVFEEMKRGFHFEMVKKNIEKGIAQGLFRNDLNTDIIARLHIEKIDVIFNSNIFPAPEFNFIQVFLELMNYHIRGIASEKGLSYLKTTIEDKKNILS